MIGKEELYSLVSSITSLLPAISQLLDQRYSECQTKSKSDFFDSFLQPLNTVCDMCSTLLTNPQVSKFIELTSIANILVEVITSIDLRKISYCLENLGSVYTLINRLISFNLQFLQKSHEMVSAQILNVLLIGLDTSDMFIRDNIMETLYKLTQKTKLLVDCDDFVVDKQSIANNSKIIAESANAIKNKIAFEIYDPNSMMGSSSI